MNSRTEVEHETVLRQEAVEALLTPGDGHYVDCTYGRGGHSALILERLGERGRLVVIDKDDEAILHARSLFAADPRVTIVKGSFGELKAILGELNIEQVDGILMDLGVSSPQLDDARRGFSFMRSGPLDMRMDQENGVTAAEWLAHAEEKEIIQVLRQYGEEKFARRIAAAIVATQGQATLTTTGELADLVEAAVPRKEKHKHPATRSFQAIRIYINGELDDLHSCLADSISLLRPGGRLVVISFHSLEDRIVKRFMRDQARGPTLPSRLPVRDADIKRDMRLVGKAVKPAEDEVGDNRRARSAIMRIAERLDT